MLLDFGVDPRAIDTMSLAEISSMLNALKRRRGNADRPMSGDEFDDLKERVAAMNLPGMRLH